MNALEKSFGRIGARIKTRLPAPLRQSRVIRSWRRTHMVRSDQERAAHDRQVRIDISRDGAGEYFDFMMGKDAAIQVLDVRPDIRHVLLMQRSGDGTKSKFLCGHDERHWFVAAIPEAASAANVAGAMEALKPDEVIERQHVEKTRNRNRRRNKAFKRQGEWFFVPVDDDAFLSDCVIHYREPLQRGRAKPHLVDELIRFGGTVVWVNADFPNGLGQSEVRQVAKSKFGHSAAADAYIASFRTMTRDPEAYVRGRVRHADHATIKLDCWHRVLMNTETRARAMAHVAFLD
jgi:hypothetical protein